MTGQARGDAGFEQVSREPSLSDKVARTITEAIVSGRLQPSEALPSERELADQFDVSRTVIREAVRSLVAQGLVETRSGRGVRVAAIDGDAVARSMNLFLRTSPGMDYAQVHEVRSGLEVRIAGLAAERGSYDEFAELGDINRRLGECSSQNAVAVANLDVEFHRGVAAAAHNPLFVVLLDAISDVLLEARVIAFSDDSMVAYAQRAHALVLERLLDRDADGAMEAMQKHIEESEAAWRTLDRSAPKA